MFIRFDMIYEHDRRTDRRMDRQTHRHHITAIAALMHSIAWQKLESCGYPTVTKVSGYGYSFWQNPRTWGTDEHIYTAWQHRPRLHSIARKIANQPKGLRTMPLPGLQIYQIQPCVTITLDFLTPKVARFMPLLCGPLVPTGLKIS